MIFTYFFSFYAIAAGFKFHLPSEGLMCFKEDLTSETLAIVEVSSKKEVGLRIMDSGNYYLYERIQAEHKYSWAALESGVYSFCAFSQTDPVEIDVEFKKGVKAKDFSQIAKTKNLKGIEVNIEKIEESVKDLHKKVRYLREREEQLRNTNATIQSRVIVYSICTICILFALAIIQIMYMKRFFKSKKMI